MPANYLGRSRQFAQLPLRIAQRRLVKAFDINGHHLRGRKLGRERIIQQVMPYRGPRDNVNRRTQTQHRGKPLIRN